MSTPPLPPPRRTVAPKGPATPPPLEGSTKMGWKDKMKAKSAVWGKVALDKSIVYSDKLGAKVNDLSEKMGSEAFYPVTGDFPAEMEKCARIVRAFTVDGLETTVPLSTPTSPSSTPPASISDKGKSKHTPHTNAKGKKTKKVLRKIPPGIIAQAKGLVIFTSMRSGIAPFGGAGGAGVVVARLPDGSWSPPSSISPNNLSTGFMLGVDIYDAILVIRNAEVMETFKLFKPTLGMDVGIAAGPFGGGAAVEAGKEKSPVLSYVRTRGLYAGVQVVGQVFVERFDENGKMYNWPGVKAGEILAGKVRMPLEAASLMEALADAESGKAQAMKGHGLDVDPESGTEITGLSANQKELEVVSEMEGMTLALDEEGKWVPSNPNTPTMSSMGSPSTVPHDPKSPSSSSAPGYSAPLVAPTQAYGAPVGYPDEKSTASYAALGYTDPEPTAHEEAGLPSYDPIGAPVVLKEKEQTKEQHGVDEMTETERRELDQHIAMLQEEMEREERERDVLGGPGGKEDRAGHLL